MTGNRKYFRYALDHESNLIHISEVNVSNRYDGYRCVSCGEVLIPAIGEKNAPHFRHKTSICNYETYLHKTAKHHLKQKFDTHKEFEILVPQNRLCEKNNNCKFGCKEMCFIRDNRKYDLKNKGLYDLCLEEQPVLDGHFIADLLITNKNNSQKPLLIEIWVTHKSTEEKKQSGLPIIEIHINNENQIDDLFTNPIGHKDATYELEFFNFKEYSNCFCHPSDIRIPLSKLTVYNSGKSFFQKTRFIQGEPVYFDCSKLNDSKKDNAQIEVVFPESTLDLIALFYCFKRGVTACYCPICLFSKDSKHGLVCKLFRTKGTPHYPQQECKTNCSFFRLDDQQGSFLEEKLVKTPIQELSEISSQTVIF